MINYYLELELDNELKNEELRTELVKTQKKWLNRTNSSDLDKRTLAEKKLQIIEEAKITLLDSQSKLDYDKRLFAEQIRPSQSVPATNDLDIEAWGTKIQDLINDENYPQAIATAKQLVDMVPNESCAWRFYGLAHRAFGNEEISRNHFIQALELDPLDMYSYAELGYSHKAFKEYEKAAHYFKQALTLNKDYEDSLRELGFLHQNFNQYDTSVEYMEKLVEKYPSSNNKSYLSYAYYLKAQSLMPMNDRNEYFFFEEEKINAYIVLTEKAQSISPREEYAQQINKARKALRKTYDWSKITLLTIPLFFLDSNSFLAIVLLGVILYFSMRPSWIIERRKSFGVDMTFDKIASIYTKTIGIVFVMIFAFIGGMFGAVIDSSRYR